MKFTRTKKEIIKYINKEIRNCKESGITDESIEPIYSLKNLKRFMTTKTDWLEL